jgi:hypothetical protein
MIGLNQKFSLLEKFELSFLQSVLVHKALKPDLISSKFEIHTKSI